MKKVEVVVFISTIYFVSLQLLTVLAVDDRSAERHSCSSIIGGCKGEDDGVEQALAYLSNFNKICLNKQLFLDHVFCLLSPQKREQHKAFLESSRNSQPKACVLKKTDKYYELEKLTYKQMLVHPQVKCILKKYQTTTKAASPSSSTRKKFGKKCPISEDYTINTAISFLRRHRPGILKRKSLAKYLFCMNSPRHSTKQRTALIDSEGEEAIPKHCSLELESKNNVYAEWDKKLYNDIRKDLRVQCILFKNGHIKVTDSSKFDVNIKFVCSKLARKDSCKMDGFEHGCAWLNDRDMHSPTVKMPGPKKSFVSVPLPEMIKKQWAQRAEDFKVHSQRLRMEQMGFSRPGMCTCLDPYSKKCVFGK